MCLQINCELSENTHCNRVNLGDSSVTERVCVSTDRQSLLNSVRLQTVGFPLPEQQMPSFNQMLLRGASKDSDTHSATQDEDDTSPHDSSGQIQKKSESSKNSTPQNTRKRKPSADKELYNLTTTDLLIKEKETQCNTWQKKCQKLSAESDRMKEILKNLKRDDTRVNRQLHAIKSKLEFLRKQLGDLEKDSPLYGRLMKRYAEAMDENELYGQVNGAGSIREFEDMWLEQEREKREAFKECSFLQAEIRALEKKRKKLFETYRAKQAWLKKYEAKQNMEELDWGEDLDITSIDDYTQSSEEGNIEAQDKSEGMIPVGRVSDGNVGMDQRASDDNVLHGEVSHDGIEGQVEDDTLSPRIHSTAGSGAE